MTRYKFAIKALPKGGGKPFEDDDEDQDEGTEATDGTDASPPSDETDPSANPSAIPDEEVPDPEATADEETPEEETPDEASAPSFSAESPEDDSRPWSGDMYDEGDETDPTGAFASYNGANGEEAWLDQAPDGTLTGWVRDATGQVWLYSDPDVWAIDVDDAEMTRTQSPANGGDSPADHGGQDPLFPPKS
ncbi:hypothetical protein [Streptomyces scopuliridis]|uniref:hypothetical protein n=1 Tax=Streptomyces scopuliridis TaxID=452529 RepID=UPI00369DD00E